MAQNDTHVALTILTTQMWGGGGIIGGKNFFGAKFVFLRLQHQHPFLDKAKGPTQNPISPTPPLLRRASMSPPPPPPLQSNFQVALECTHAARTGQHPRLATAPRARPARARASCGAQCVAMPGLRPRGPWGWRTQQVYTQLAGTILCAQRAWGGGGHGGGAGRVWQPGLLRLNPQPPTHIRNFRK